ncbi:N-acetylmuramoyl-L-alanine amidase [Aureimonas sp. Leaf454]|uniref:N-acetylmuramoyl-L-alanine amidase n=1 Tax=Aureimonas sp. Leaf454 TaxID=1736381 RepID=UPI0006FBEE2A|nr:N-acetylmuramoyl-L-alanine amidase [Aureimonas sp. Leaf454]KQT50911.1 N-acetylmuramoyl-L-alanine amidase [Aureimonas sp. Leaf454]
MSAALLEADSALVTDLLPSPNCNDRRVATGPDMILLHYTGMEDGEMAARWLALERSQVSCHYLVHEDGRIVQLVREAMRAWHAGAGTWRGRDDVNSRSIGIEIVNPGHDHGYRPFPDAQIEAVIALCRDIRSRWTICAEAVLAHSDIAPARKQDPGELFPWARLHRAGLGHFVEPSPIRGGRFFGLGDEGEPVAAYQGLLAAYGYEVEATGRFDESTRFATIAFQRHFRPAKVDGIADHSTIETLHRLLVSLPTSPFATV